jgi:multimeric flavodoxin WrbA
MRVACRYNAAGWESADPAYTNRRSLREGAKMKVIAFNGSGRKDGNTATLIDNVFGELQKEGIETELFQLAGKKIRGCVACYKCFQNKDQKCSAKSDVLNECIDKMLESDGIILGSPTYFANVSTEMKALIDRAGLVAIANGHMFKRRVGAAVVAVRRAGSIHAFNSMNHFFFINQMIVPGSIYWNMGIGRQPGEVEKDEEGVRTMKILGSNMAWALKKLRT